MLDNKALAKAYFERFSKGDLKGATDLMTFNCAHHFPGLGGDHAGPQSWSRTAASLRHAFPDLNFTVHAVIAEGDRAAARVTWTGTHQGAFANVPPSGKRVEVHATCIFRIANGKIAEQWAEQDILALYQQIGAIAGDTPAYKWSE